MKQHIQDDTHCDPHSRGLGGCGVCHSGTSTNGSFTGTSNSLGPFTTRVSISTPPRRGPTERPTPSTPACVPRGKALLQPAGPEHAQWTPGAGGVTAPRLRPFCAGVPVIRTPRFPPRPLAAGQRSRGRAPVTLPEAPCGPREARGRAATAPVGRTAGPGVAAHESGNHASARSVARGELRGDAGPRGGGRGAGGREGDDRRAAPGRDAVPGRAVSERGGRGRGAAVGRRRAGRSRGAEPVTAGSPGPPQSRCDSCPSLQ